MRDTLLIAAIQSGALFLAVWLLFRLVPAIPVNAKAWVWRLAFLKPVLSLLPFAVVPLHVLPAPHVEVSAPEIVVAAPASISEATTVFVAAPEEPPRIDPLLVIWLSGAAGVLGYGLLGWLRASRIVRHAQPVEDPTLRKMLLDLRHLAEIDTPVRLVRSSSVSSPMLVGGFKMTIVLPETVAEDSSDMRLMLAHEVAHIARRDLVWFGASWLSQAIFFFNPMVWLAAHASRLDHESATDRYASQLANVPVQIYADMLLRATVVARTPLAPGFLPMAESYRTIHRRLEAMKHFNYKPSRMRSFALGALALTTVGMIPMYQLAEAAPMKPDGTPVRVAQPAHRSAKHVKKTAKKKTAVHTVARVNGVHAAHAVVIGNSVAASSNRIDRAGVTATAAVAGFSSQNAARAGGRHGVIASQAASAGGRGVARDGQTTNGGGGLAGGVATDGAQRGGFGGGGGVASAGAQSGGFGGGGGGGVASAGAQSGGFGGGGGVAGAGGGGFGGGGGVAGAGAQSGGFGGGGGVASAGAQGGGFGGGGGIAVAGVQAGGLGGGVNGVTTAGRGRGFGGSVSGVQTGPVARMGGGGNRVARATRNSSGDPLSARTAPVNTKASVSTSKDGKVGFQFDGFDTKSALQLLFIQCQRQYTLDPKIHGTLTAAGHNLSFEIALKVLVASGNVGCRVENGRYIITAK